MTFVLPGFEAAQIDSWPVLVAGIQPIRPGVPKDAIHKRVQVFLDMSGHLPATIR